MGESPNCAKLTHMKHFVTAALLFTPFCVPPAYADQTLLESSFTSGRYIEAASLGETQADPDGLAFAARCLLAEAMSAPDFIPPQEIVIRAEDMARRALAQDANHIEARLQLAIALSLRAHPLTTRQAMRTGFGDEAKALAEAVLIDDPTNSYANGFLAVWHIEVVRRGGAVGSAIMGASMKQSRRLYEMAAQVNPDDASLHWSYARALTALNARKYRGEIDKALNNAITANTDSELERVMQARARTLQNALNSEKRRKVQKIAEKML